MEQNGSYEVVEMRNDELGHVWETDREQWNSTEQRDALIEQVILEEKNFDKELEKGANLEFMNNKPREVEKWMKQHMPPNRSLVNTAWYLCFGTPMQHLCNRRDKVILEGQLMKYKPGVENSYISRWC